MSRDLDRFLLSTGARVLRDSHNASYDELFYVCAFLKVPLADLRLWISVGRSASGGARGYILFMRYEYRRW